MIFFKKCQMGKSPYHGRNTVEEDAPAGRREEGEGGNQDPTTDENEPDKTGRQGRTTGGQRGAEEETRRPPPHPPP